VGRQQPSQQRGRTAALLQARHHQARGSRGQAIRLRRRGRVSAARTPYHTSGRHARDLRHTTPSPAAVRSTSAPRKWNMLGLRWPHARSYARDLAVCRRSGPRCTAQRYQSIIPFLRSSVRKAAERGANVVTGARSDGVRRYGAGWRLGGARQTPRGVSRQTSCINAPASTAIRVPHLPAAPRHRIVPCRGEFSQIPRRQHLVGTDHPCPTPRSPSSACTSHHDLRRHRGRS